MVNNKNKIISTCKEILQKSNISSSELEFLLISREKGLVSFSLVDIRELMEYSKLSIKGTNLLLPTSTMHLHLEAFEELRKKPFVLYCRTGNRTGHMLKTLRRMKFEQASHLEKGIVSYKGETMKNAPLPNDI